MTVDGKFIDCHTTIPDKTTYFGSYKGWTTHRPKLLTPDEREKALTELTRIAQEDGDYEH